MILHDNIEAFSEIVAATADGLKLDTYIIEKDYYVTMLLKLLIQKLPDMVFKGGTSLTKCYGNMIQRFSEDIDLTYSLESGKPGDARKRRLKKAVTEAFDELGLEIYNLNETRSRKDYNCYRAVYKSIYAPIPAVPNELVVETYVALLSFPTEKRMATNYIYQYLHEQGEHNIIATYSLEPFEITTQDIRRTLVDKVFALCDYYLLDKIHNHSRHIYDIYQLQNAISLDIAEMTALVEQVRHVRKGLTICPSAEHGIDMNGLIAEIVAEEIYKQDYKDITEKLIFSPVPYETAIQGLEAIRNYGIFTSNSEK